MTEGGTIEPIGYGRLPPDPAWPKRARLALQFAVHYHEEGDSGADAGRGGAGPGVSGRSSAYGSRAGFWRLHRLLAGHALPVTLFGTTRALGNSRELVAAMLEGDWEIASHGYRLVDRRALSEEEERRELRQAIEAHRAVVGQWPTGWYAGRASRNTRRLLIEEGGFLYDSDSYDDDLPYWISTQGRPHLVIPHAPEAGDPDLAEARGFGSGAMFYAGLKDAFDALYAEGETAAKMMSVPLHCGLAGRPGPAAGLERFLDYALGHDRVWLCRRVDVARHWHEYHPPPRAAGDQAP